MLLYLLVALVSSASLFGMGRREGRWEMDDIFTSEISEVKKEAKVEPKHDPENEREMAELFNLMNPQSKLREKCLGSSTDYHCRKIAAMLHCAKPNQTTAHAAFCKRADIKSGGALEENWSEIYHTSNLADDNKLSPQQTTREIEWFLESLKNTSQGKK